MRELVEVIESPDSVPADVAALGVPGSFRAAVLHKEDAGRFEGVPLRERRPADSLHIEEVPTPEPGPGEVLVAVMASAVNYNTVWSALFSPVPTFALLERYARLGGLAARHDQPFHVIGSDLSGVVVKCGPGVRRWGIGDRVVAHCVSVELEDAEGHGDPMLDPEQRIWGYETNYGGLADLALVKATQLLPKAEHLTWEEAAAPGLVNSTAYRQLVTPNGAGMKQGDNVLIWGAVGGLGSYATQLALAGGANPVCVVSSPEKAALARELGAELIIDRNAEGYRFWRDPQTQDPKEWRRFGSRIRELTGGEDVDIVFEHPGRETFGASVYVTRKGGTIVTCASTAGYVHEYDNRYLWMSLKRIVGSHCANYREAWQANRLITKARIHPTLSRTYALENVAEAVESIHRNEHHGKVGVLCLAPTEGLGVRDPELRARHEPAINRFRTAAQRAAGTRLSGVAA
ncbi:crotonyl-CoA carboxylase/reductase [Streptomyces cylindrosporus]|uniref:Crotonyl-CoA carboxylase/reductase n=1 Tax=Streptomyces cylindrosporus TaxID=2927583 RepID=A0ABS9Y2P5_9ACTN|nr:crotonyl-CoA carboxylase/reductase [Streptomyces cylindrosporus]MCI3271289.1 crotonyl-CoA carboxylase/reductase [Streptomyces cylindrosporus]